jgi:2-polyprenyl-3-methyl-5-hydroxy-6-metoxy-1,4-benzoquinol methylase
VNAPAYLAHTLYRDPVDLKKLRFLVGELDLVGPPPLDILEIGCGSGNIALPLASLGHRVRATDIDARSIEYVRSRGSAFPNLSLEVADIDRSTGPVKSRYDAVIASEVLEHVTDPAGALARLRPLLKGNGVVLVTIPNGYGPWEIGQALSPRRAAGWLARKTGLHGPLKKALRIQAAETAGDTSTLNFESPHLHHFTLPRFAAMAEQAGFRVVRRFNSDGPLTFFPGGRRLSPLARVDCRLVDHLPSALASGWYLVLALVSPTSA